MNAAQQLAAMRRKVEKDCSTCGEPFTGLKTALYCSDSCRYVAAYKRDAEKKRQRYQQRRKVATVRKAPRVKRTNDAADCSIRAVVAVTGSDYDTVWHMFKANGRRTGQRTPRIITAKVVGKLGFKTEPWTVHGKTIKTVERELPPKGAFLISVVGHILAVVDGVTHDWTAGRRNRVKDVRRVTLK